jgi:hypothetical protein
MLVVIILWRRGGRTVSERTSFQPQSTEVRICCRGDDGESKSRVKGLCPFINTKLANLSFKITDTLQAAVGHFSGLYGAKVTVVT